MKLVDDPGPAARNLLGADAALLLLLLLAAAPASHCWGCAKPPAWASHSRCISASSSPCSCCCRTARWCTACYRSLALLRAAMERSQRT